MLYQISFFDPAAIARSGQCFRMQEEQDGSFSVFSASRHLTLRPLGEGRYDFLPDGGEDDLPYWETYFDLSCDYEAMNREIPEGDGFLRLCADHSHGLRILRQDPFETLISFIISQRKSIPAIRQCIEKLCCAFGQKTASGYAFPTAEAIAQASLEQLGACSLGYRAAYVRDSARMVLHAGLPSADTSLSDASLKDLLLTFPGVGIKVAGCVMLFGYHRLASAPVDVWIQRIIDRKYDGVSPFEAYGEYAGLYQQYMFLHAKEFLS